MKSIKFCITFLLTTLAINSSLVFANANAIFDIGSKLHTSRWQFDSNNQSKKSSANSGQLALNFKFRYKNLYTGINIQGGEFDFDAGQSPYRTTPINNAGNTKTSIKRGEFDLVIGYYFWEKISLFWDIKSISTEWKIDGYKSEYAGLGFGGTLHHNFNTRWTLFGTFGITPLKIEINSNKAGNANAAALEVGSLFRINDKTNVTMSLKLQQQKLRYDTGVNETHGLVNSLIGINRAF